MKLLDKYNRLSITATILTFVIGSCTFYFLLNYILIRELDERLQTEQQEIQAYVATHKVLPDIVRTKDLATSFEPATAAGSTEFITIKNNRNKESENARQIQFTVVAEGRYYLAKVAAPLDETEALLRVIIGVTVAMIAIILLIGFLINRVVIRRLWQPFYETITKVKAYQLSEQETLRLSASEIDEFSLLNRSIGEMVERIQADYGSLKDFTGQAAHEMQTPLAVIRTRLDGLMQHEAILEHSGTHIADIETAVHRLSRLHGSLLLLTKVENRQFELNEAVRLDDIITARWAEYAEMASVMQLKVSVALQPVTIRFHQHLAEIVVGNLLNNAIRYNMPGGAIEITLQANSLSVANTSASGQLDEARLFKRFYRGNTAEEGTGLGLSIVQQVCSLAGFVLSYQCTAGRHTFTITFNDF